GAVHLSGAGGGTRGDVDGRKCARWRGKVHDTTAGRDAAAPGKGGRIMSNGPRVLVVDDELQIRRFLRISLEANGYRVFESSNGHDALQEAARLRPDLIILDMGLPDIEGLEVLTRLREWSAAPVIILSVRD